MIRLRQVTKRYAAQGRPVVDDLSLEVEEGQTVVLLGSSGCGKTTVLRLIDRLISPSSGTIELGGCDIASIPPIALRRSIGHVFQQPGLFPHLTVAENVGLLMKLEGVEPVERAERVDELLHITGLNPVKYRDRFPDELSGGQQQRIGVARALALHPKVMLMDEPFGALDNITRRTMQEEIKRIRAKFGVTILFVTHDILEAVNLGDKIAVMNAGRIEQFGTGEDIVQRPATDFVRELIATPFAEMRRMASELLEPSR